MFVRPVASLESKQTDRHTERIALYGIDVAALRVKTRLLLICIIRFKKMSGSSLP